MGKLFARMNSTTSARFSTWLYGGEYMALFYERDGLGGDTLHAPDEAQLLRGRGLDVDRGGRDAEILGDVADHPRHVRRHARLLREDRRVDVHDPEPRGFHFLSRLPEQHAAVDLAVAGIRMGIVPADVAQRRRAEQRIADRVQQDVGVRMPEQALAVRNDHPADHELPSLGERMHIEPLPDPHAVPASRVSDFRIASAMAT